MAQYIDPRTLARAIVQVQRKAAQATLANDRVKVLAVLPGNRYTVQWKNGQINVASPFATFKVGDWTNMTQINGVYELTNFSGYGAVT